MKRLLILSALLVLWGSAAVAAQAPIQSQKFRPQWQIGQQWTVQTQSLQQQVAIGQQQVVTAQWQFHVQAVEPIQGQACVRIAIRPLQGQRVQAEPKTTVWVDQATFSIRQIQTQLPTQQGYKTVSESYEPGQKASPVIGPLSVLPIALPQFSDEGLKAVGTFQYDTISGAGGIKAIGQIGFTTEIRQEFKQASQERIKSLVGEEGIKDLANRESVEVELSTTDEKLQQIWVADMPWPIFAENGTTKATLTAVGPNGRAPEPVENAAPHSPAGAAPAADGVNAMNPAGATEQAQSTIRPWSGYWWPIQEGRLIGTLAKYDTITGHQAAVWEKKHNPPGPNVPRWFGYCHAWAAASILETEPNQDHNVRAGGGSVALNVGDQKGLLTACHTRDLANSWGDRFGDGQGSEDPQDLSPDRLWRLLQMHLGQQKVPLVMDLEAGEQVWNYPIYAYVIRYKPVSGGQFLADLDLLMADDAVYPSHQGTKIRKQTCQFTFEMQRGNVVTGSSQWTGASREDHPDFAWYPYQAVAENPEIERPRILKLVSSAATPGSTPPAESAQPTTSVTTPAAQPTASATQPTTPATQPTAPATPTTAPIYPPTWPVSGEERPATQATTEQDGVEPATGPIIVSPLELAALIANKTSSFQFDAMLDRFEGSSYQPGETFFVRVKGDKAGYLYLLQVDSTGTPALIYPTAGEDNRIPAGKLLDIKPSSAAGGFPVVGPAGVVRIKAVVTSRPLVFSGSLDPLPIQVQQQQQSQMQDQGQKPAQQQTTQQQPAQQSIPQQGPTQQQIAQQQTTQQRTDQQETDQNPIAQQSLVIVVQFRWHPTQWKQIKGFLAGERQLSEEQMGCRSPQEVLGAFAQDLTTFYVDLPGKPEADKAGGVEEPAKSRLFK